MEYAVPPFTKRVLPAVGLSMVNPLLSIGFIQVLIILVNIGRAKGLSILLGPAGFGIVSTIDQVVLSAVQLGGLAIPFIALKFLSHAHSESHEKLATSFAAFFRALLGLSVFTTLILLAAIYVKPDIFGKDILPYIEYLNLALLGAPCLMLSLYFVNTLAAAQKTAASVRINFLFTLVLAVAACLGVWLGGLWGLYIATLVTGIFATIITLIYLDQGLNLSVFHADGSVLKMIKQKPQIVSMAASLYLAMSAYTVTMLIVRFFIFSSQGEAEAGFYQALLSIALALGAVVGPMNTLFLTPILNRNMEPQLKFDAAHDFQRNLSVILTAIALPVILFPKLALFVLFSSEFIGVFEVVFVFVFWQCFYQITYAYQQLLIGLDDVNYCSASLVVGYIVGIALCYPLVNGLGLIGAALVLVVANTITLIAISVRMSRRFNSAVPIDLWLRIVFCLGSIVGVGFVFTFIDEWSLLGLVTRVLVGMLYIAILWWLLSDDQKQQLLALRRKLPF